MYTTNYYNTFIAVAEDCPVTEAEVPKLKAGEQTAAGIQLDMIESSPYTYTSDDVLFTVHARKQHLTPQNSATDRELFFSKGQPCLRCSPLTKRYGWGIHHDAEGKVAIYPAESAEYRKLSEDPTLKQVKGMRSKRA